jgi:H+-transporting ATPase
MARKNKFKEFEEKSYKQLLEEHEVDPEEGLNSNEAASRRKKYGLNEIESKDRHPFIEFLSHFWGPIPCMIEIAVILSAVAGRWEDFAVIFTMQLINGVGS